MRGVRDEFCTHDRNRCQFSTPSASPRTTVRPSLIGLKAHASRGARLFSLAIVSRSKRTPYSSVRRSLMIQFRPRGSTNASLPFVLFAFFVALFELMFVNAQAANLRIKRRRG